MDFGMTRKPPGLLSLLFVLPMASPALPSRADNTATSLPLMVVSATGYRQQALMSPAAITVLEQEQLNQQPVSDLAEVLRDIPGIAIVDSGVPGMKRLSLRGESARRVLVKINGQPLADHSNYGTPLLIDINMIERVEVVRGPSSVVHGGNALGGVINIITRQASAGEQEVIFSSGHYSATRGQRVSAGVLAARQGLDMRLQASRTSHQDRRLADGTLENSDSLQRSVSAELGYSQAQHHISWQGDYFKQYASAWVEPDSGIDYLRFPERNSLRHALNYEYLQDHGSLQKINARMYQHNGRRVMENAISSQTPVVAVNVDNFSDDDLLTSGGQLSTEARWLGNNLTVAGMEYQSDRLDTDKRSQTTLRMLTLPVPPTVTEKTSAQQAEQNQWSAFLQQQIVLTADAEAHAGLRYYRINSRLTDSTERSDSDNHDDEMVGSVSMVWRATPASALRINLAQGYSYPSVTQQFAVTAGGSNVHFGNPDLTAEKATTLEFGFRLDNKQWLLDLALYYNRARDFIDREALTAAPPEYTTTTTASQSLWRWVNINEAKSYGLELAVSRQLKTLRPYANITVQRRELDFASGEDTWNSG
ncbi:MAG: hypothetical protein COW58_15265, partial [Thalassolituus sp. CG17_big_fil_post_rev_8_21_14_2_50_53_8]